MQSENNSATMLYNGLLMLLICSASMTFSDAGAVSKRDLSGQYSIETRVVVDQALYDSWAAQVDNGEVTDADTAITEYVNALFADLNAIFAGLASNGINIDLRLADLVILQNEAPVTYDSDGILYEFREWLQGKSYSTVDHTMLLTGLDITNVTSGSTSVAGKAFVGGMCNTNNDATTNDVSLSVAEAPPSGAAAVVIAHEVGHNLGASHDGEDGNDCPMDGYIMAATADTGDSDSYLEFSSCSISYFLAHLQEKASCLQDTSVDAVTSQRLGELHDPDAICRLNLGPDSYFARYFYDEEDYPDMCFYIWCNQGLGTTASQSVRSPEGFVCGNGKKCSLGECVVDTTAPTDVTDVCPQGDITAQITSDYGSCEALLSEFPGYCYQDIFEAGCCTSCAALNNTAEPYCAYGDTSSSCSSTTSCSAGTNTEICCDTCAWDGTDAYQYACSNAYNNCDSLVAGHPGYCYIDAVLTGCCACEDAATDNPDCPYGDYWTNCDATMCDRYPTKCCATCA